MAGKLIIFAAPSGSGKTSIVKFLIERIDNQHFSVSATNRPIRKNETDGKDYYFLSTEAFEEKIRDKAFVEWEEVYDGRFYGTLKSSVDNMLNAGKNVIFDVDVKGALNLKSTYGTQALSVFVKPPSLETLEHRLHKRKTDSSEDIKRRTNKAEWEMNFAPEFDVIVVNDKLEQACRESLQKVKEFLNQ
ncbi:MAG: guanylate kinase [Candidatus Delongbacteria bacterium]|jgi:guanylate kinase|nr:guanylate kinase [Candidatus Delongbacteria bacterium]